MLAGQSTIEVGCVASGLYFRYRCSMSDEDFLNSLADVQLRLGEALLRYGAPSHRIERVLKIVSELYEVRCQAFATPTGLWMALEKEGIAGQVVRLVRVDSTTIDLARLVSVDGVFNRLADREITLREAMENLEAIAATPSKPLWRLIISGALAAVFATALFGGGPAEWGLSVLTAPLVIGCVALASRRRRTLFLSDWLAGFLATLLTCSALVVVPALKPLPVIFGLLVFYVPGLSLTLAMSELAHRNLVAGSARLLHALLVLMMLVAGAVSAWLCISPWLPMGVDALLALGGETLHPVLSIAVTGAAVLSCAEILGLPVRRWLPALLAGVMGNAVMQALGLYEIIIPVLAFGSAMVLTMVSNALARVYREPSQAFLVPGFLLLVPGITGFRAFGVLASGDLMSGVSTVLTVFTVALGLVLGLLFGHVLLPSRKAL